MTSPDAESAVRQPSIELPKRSRAALFPGQAKTVAKCAIGLTAAALVGRATWRMLPPVIGQAFAGGFRGDPIGYRTETVGPAAQASALPQSWDPQSVFAAFEGLNWSFGGREGRIGNLLDFLSETGTSGFLVLRGRTLLWEWHARDLPPEHAFRLRSASKAIVSTLAGIAIDEGRLKLSDSAHDILGIARHRGSLDVTVEMLLHMQLGPMALGRLGQLIDWAAETYPYDIRALADARLAQRRTRPAESLYYSETNLWILAAVLEKLYGISLAELLSRKLWQPLGMEFPAYWITDRLGMAAASVGLMAAARDMARLGRFFLAGGTAEGRPLVSPAWLAKAWSPPEKEGPGYYDQVRDWPQVKGIESPFYGYCWWGARRRQGHQPDVYAVGTGAQILYLSRANDVAIVRLGRALNWFDGWTPLLFAAAPRLAERSPSAPV